MSLLTCHCCAPNPHLDLFCGEDEDVVHEFIKSKETGPCQDGDSDRKDGMMVMTKDDLIGRTFPMEQEDGQKHCVKVVCTTAQRQITQGNDSELLEGRRVCFMQGQCA